MEPVRADTCLQSSGRYQVELTKRPAGIAAAALARVDMQRQWQPQPRALFVSQSTLRFLGANIKRKDLGYRPKLVAPPMAPVAATKGAQTAGDPVNRPS